MKLCRDRIALTICGITVSSYPMTPANNGPPLHNRARRFWRISSLTERSARSGTPYGERFRAPRVSGYDDDTAISWSDEKLPPRQMKRCESSECKLPRCRPERSDRSAVRGLDASMASKPNNGWDANWCELLANRSVCREGSFRSVHA